MNTTNTEITRHRGLPHWDSLIRMARKPRTFAALLASLFFGASAGAQVGEITTVAGNGVAAYGGDGGPATSASLNSPLGVAAFDTAGNIYIADINENRIRVVNTAGIISTFAGTGVAGYNGDGIAATAAQLAFPSDVQVDAGGNVYISDGGNNRIRMINTSGVISTIVGTGVAGFSGDGGPAVVATISNPHRIWIDRLGNLYVADTGNNRVRMVDTSGIITTIAGNGVAGFGGDGGPATLANLNSPRGVTVDAAGNLYIADLLNNRIRIVAGGIINTFAGNGIAGFAGDGGPAFAAELNSPRGAVADRGLNVFIADEANNRIRVVNASNGIISTFAGTGVAGFSGDGGPPTNANLDNPYHVALDTFGNLYIADDLNERIRKVQLSPLPATDGPLPIWSLVVLGAMLIGIGSRGLRVRTASPLPSDVHPIR
jgi:sugar lactone lactonase YvrE